jgi:hypothetical protein
MTMTMTMIMTMTLTMTMSLVVYCIYRIFINICGQDGRGGY